MNDPQNLSVGIEEYSDLKIEVADRLIKSLTGANGRAN